ncbi:MAG TPA: F0F1 ATP synthase subunit gamma [Candidatus Levybacteria bacterium]|nr:F0F1 ATP synthase subunit gamma [Candidatus Levybacteria bacterium]
MQNKNKTTSELELVGTLKMLAEAYEEVSVLKMQKVRGSVLTTRDFLDGLSSVFVDVKRNYGRRIQKLMKNKGTMTTFSTRAHNGKKLSVFLSANSKFYGDIIRRVFDVFIKDIQTKNSEILIIGKMGKELMEGSKLKKNYYYFDLSDGEISVDDLTPIIDTLVKYETVDVYYGRFSNMVNQLPTLTNVSGQEILETKDISDQEVVQYAFEPSLEEILTFFENQVFVSLFKQTVNEGELARLASRIRAMEEALGNIEKLEPQIIREGRAYRKSQQNKKQLGVMTSVSFLRQMQSSKSNV